jgi:hypothetical protein
MAHRLLNLAAQLIQIDSVILVILDAPQELRVVKLFDD